MQTNKRSRPENSQTSTNIADSKRRKKEMDENRWQQWDERFLTMLGDVRHNVDTTMGKRYSIEFYRTFARRLSEASGIPFSALDCGLRIRRLRDIFQSYSEVPQKQKRPEAETHPFKYASLTTINELNLNQEKIDLMKDSCFSSLLSVTLRRESSSSFLSAMLKCYDPVNKVFHFSEKTSFSFCTKEVASVLGMSDSGICFADYDNKCKKVTTFPKDLKQKYPAFNKNTLASFRETMATMSVDDEEGKLDFKKIMTYFLLEGLLLPACNSLKVPRVQKWGLVTNVEECWTVNWAEEICRYLHTSLEACQIRHKIDPSKQHPFYGALFVLEAIVFERVLRLRPDLSPVDFPPVQKYAASRRSAENIDGILRALEPTDVVVCPDCPLPVEHTPDSESVSLGEKFEALSMSSAGKDALVEEEKLVCEGGDAGGAEGELVGGDEPRRSTQFEGDAGGAEGELVGGSGGAEGELVGGSGGAEGGDAGGAEEKLVCEPRRSTRIRVPSRRLQKTPPATPSKPKPSKKLRNVKASKK